MSPALFQTTLYASLALCALGLMWRISAWFRVQIGRDVRELTLSQRMTAAFRGAVLAPFGWQASRLARAFFLDVLLQWRLFAVAKLRWLGHFLIVIGFMWLLLMHAFAAAVTEKLFPGYQPTLNPYLFLRDLGGVMVLIGVALLLFGQWRRNSDFPPRRRLIEWAFVALLGFVLVSGFLLAADKIASPRTFYRMADQYIGSTDAEKLKPLRAFWRSEFGVAFDDLKVPIDPGLAETGRKLHVDSCASCHAKPGSAFVSYSVAKVLAPMTGLLDTARAEAWLLYLHVFACFVGLATLPFTRFFHVVAAPIALLVNGAAPNHAFSTAARATRRALALDACVRCGVCDLNCSVAPQARFLGNPGLLPSHKLIATGALVSGRLLRAGHEDDALRAADGAFLCTDCGRCTSQCPVGLDLADLWDAGRSDLAAAGLPGTAQWMQARPALAWTELLERGAGQHTVADPDSALAPLSSDARTFSRCVQCQTCTNVCPVVAHSIDTDHGVDLTPQKVMNLLRMGQRDLALGSRMVWDCATCYQCQEHCPEGIRVTDIMCELRTLAVNRLGPVRNWRAPS